MDAPVKTRIILAKPSTERNLDRRSASEIGKSTPSKGFSSSTDSHSLDNVAPTRILKAKDSGRRTASPAPQITPSNSSSAFALPSVSPSLSSRDLNSSEDGISSITPTKIHIQQKSQGSTASTSVGLPSHERFTSEGNTLEGRLARNPEMKSCVKLVDESLQWCDKTSEFLLDQTDYLVVGVLGLQGTGKSTIMSHLFGNRGLKNAKHGIFKSQSKDQRELGEHCTQGIDIVITNQRMILLDVQPILSASIMDHLIQVEKKFPVEYNSTENALEIQSLQIAAFLFTVCHTVILIQDWFTDPNFLRFIQTAEMLRPSAFLTKQDGTYDDTTEYCPNIVLVHNKCTPTDYEPSKVKLVQELYSNVFHRSKLKFKGDLAMTSGAVVPCLCPKTCGESINLFLLPIKEDKEGSKSFQLEGFPEYRGHQGFQQLMNNLIEQIISMPRGQMSPATLTEKNWFHYAARTWESVKKSGLFMEYCRLLA